MSPKKENKGNIIRQGSILAVASIVVRIIGLFYRVPMANVIGEEAMGIYSASFEIYNIILILSSFSLPLAVSKLISEKMTNNDYANSYKILVNSLIFSFIIGGLASLILFFNAQWIEKTFLNKYHGVAISLRILAPTIFIVAIMGVFRGFFQGKNKMLPTAFSQIIEQIVNAIISIVAAIYLTKLYSLSDNVSAWGAAGGTLGTCIGALSGLLFLLLLFFLYLPQIKRQIRRQQKQKNESAIQIYKLIGLTILPVILSQTVYQLSSVIDLGLFNNIMGAKGVSEVTVSTVQGNYSTLYKLLISVPIAVSSSFAGSIIPSIVISFSNRQYNNLRNKIKGAVQFNMNIAIPSTIGLMVLGKPILRLLFPSYNIELGSTLLFWGAIAIIFYAHSTITSSVLQSLNKMKIPVINASIAIVFHIFVVYIFLKYTNWDIYALILGNIVFPLIVMILNNIALKKYINYNDNYKKIFLIPILSSIGMGIICSIVYKFVFFITASNILSVLISIFAGILVYFSLVLKLRGINSKELIEFPFGRTMFEFALKLHLLDK